MEEPACPPRLSSACPPSPFDSTSTLAPASDHCLRRLRLQQQPSTHSSSSSLHSRSLSLSLSLAGSRLRFSTLPSPVLTDRPTDWLPRCDSHKLLFPPSPCSLSPPFLLDEGYGAVFFPPPFPRFPCLRYLPAPLHSRTPSSPAAFSLPPVTHRAPYPVNLSFVIFVFFSFVVT